MSLRRCDVPNAHRFIWMRVVTNVTFIVLRDPPGRALSADQEVSCRRDHGEVTKLKQSTSSS